MKKIYNNPLTKVMPLAMQGSIMVTSIPLSTDPHTMRRRDPIP